MSTNSILFTVFSWGIAAINLFCFFAVVKLIRRTGKQPWTFLAVMLACANLFWAGFYSFLEITGIPYTVQMGAMFVRPGLLFTSSVILMSVISLIEASGKWKF